MSAIPASQPDGEDRGNGGEQARLNQRDRQKAATRRRLLDAATEVFIEQGPLTASLEEIANRAGVSRPTLFFHFGSRTELMEQVSAYHLERYRATGHKYRPGELRPFVKAFLHEQGETIFRLVWLLGDILHPGGTPHGQPENPNASYWNLVDELEQRMLVAGVAPADAHDRAVVLAPALILVGRRIGQEMTTDREVREIVDAICHMALAGSS